MYYIYIWHWGDGMLPFPVPGGDTLFCLNQNIPSHLYIQGLGKLTPSHLQNKKGDRDLQIWTPYYLAACHNMSQPPTPNPPGFHGKNLKLFWGEIRKYQKSTDLLLRAFVWTNWWTVGIWGDGDAVLTFTLYFYLQYILLYIYPGHNLMGSYCIHKYCSRCLEGVLVSDDWFVWKHNLGVISLMSNQHTVSGFTEVFIS